MKKILLYLLIAGIAFSHIYPAFRSGAETILEPASRSDVKKVSMNFENAALKDILKAFSRQTGLNFIASQGIEEKTITIYLNDVSTEDALFSILVANGLTYEKQKGDVYVVKPSGAREIKTVTKVFKLNYLQVYNMSGEGDEATLGTSTASEPFSMSDTSGGTDKALREQTVAAQSVLASSGKQKDIMSIVRNLLSEYGRVVADKRNNSIIVTDIRERIEAIGDVIKELDIEPVQVMIQAEIIETTTDAVKRVGVQYGTETQTAAFTYGDLVAGTPFPFTHNFIKELFGGTLTDAAQSASPTNFTFGTLTASDSQIVLQLFSEDEDTKFLSKPRIMTINNESAIIKVSADTAIGIESTSVTETSEVIETAERFETGVILKVTPSVNDKGDIFMYIEPTIARAQSSTFFSTRFMDPQVRSAASTVMVKESETVVIAGLIKTDNYRTIRKIPFLGDIPIFGEPFKSRYKKVEDTEIIIFITPKVVKQRHKETILRPPVTSDRDYLIERALEKYSQKEGIYGTD